jgi:DNA-binding response OmpR family regulator
MTKPDAVVGVLEDDPDMAALVSHWLEEAGYTVRVFFNATEFRRRQGGESIDLLLLDWMLPDSSGIEVIGAIRAAPNNRLPVIFLTARDAEDDIVRALAAGGDD